MVDSTQAGVVTASAGGKPAGPKSDIAGTLQNKKGGKINCEFRYSNKHQSMFLCEELGQGKLGVAPVKIANDGQDSGVRMDRTCPGVGPHTFKGKYQLGVMPGGDSKPSIVWDTADVDKDVCKSDSDSSAKCRCFSGMEIFGNTWALTSHTNVEQAQAVKPAPPGPAASPTSAPPQNTPQPQNDAGKSKSGATTIIAIVFAALFVLVGGFMCLIKQARSGSAGLSISAYGPVAGAEADDDDDDDDDDDFD